MRPLKVVVLLALLCAALVVRAEVVFPTLSGRVVDDANLLDAHTRAQLGQMLEAHEQATGEQVVVATVPDLQGLEIEDYGYRLGRHWGIGQKGKDNGALLIVAPQQRKVRIEVGYGLEERLTDAQSSVIINRIILPAFKRGEMSQGIVQGSAAILQVLGGNPLAQPSRVSSADGEGEPPSLWAIGLFIVLVVVVLYLQGLGGGGRRGGPGGGFGGGFGGLGGGGRGGGGFGGGGGSFGGGGSSGSW
ncbi:TPM domain-containing protein [Pseudomonas sp. 148P]|uniref:TPM domain-containing protein n=1 Tax=Pseudomonas ulcerans TaxID=3115852 RepID=A0ABU7HLR6_9PSED|nr:MULTISPECIES: TPM domain-containing protein [unclassified Pseudomonas]MEE1921171.1 TPM domain-containing protein [Pseudomonas sp. 147P]MEE1932480.1 TPM domain-containing protein [Pseudomonas sp. 148P]